MGLIVNRIICDCGNDYASSDVNGHDVMTKFEILLGILFMLMSALTLAVTILMCMAMGA